MSLSTAKKAEVIKSYAVKSGDTGSPEVQVALLSERITDLTEHFKTHVKDNHSRRGLLKLVSQRRQILDYLRRTNEGRYKGVDRAAGYPPLKNCARAFPARPEGGPQSAAAICAAAKAADLTTGQLPANHGIGPMAMAGSPDAVWIRNSVANDSLSPSCSWLSRRRKP